jgi:hypothetical protein
MYFFTLAALSWLGFSTLILLGVFFSFGLFHLIYNRYDFNIGSVLKIFKENYSLLVYFLIIVFSALSMVYVTTYQLQHPAYQTESLIQSVLIIASVALGAFSLNGAALTLASISFLSMRYRNDLVMKLVYIFVAIVFLISVGRLINLYPIIYSRHLIWLIPFGIVFKLEAINLIYLDYEVKSIVSIPLIILFALAFSLQPLRGNLRTNQIEYTNNNKLYETIANFGESQFVVYHNALPSLLVYQNIDDQLQNFDLIYYDWSNNEIITVDRDDIRLRRTLELLEKNQSYYMIFSHIDMSNLKNPDTRNVLFVFDDFGISYEFVLFDNNVSILKIYMPLE